MSLNQNLKLAGPARQRGRRASFIERHFTLLMMLPAFILVTLVTVVPIAVGIGYSFTNMNLNRPNRVKFIGLDNYFELLEDRWLPLVLLITFTFVIGALILEVLAGLGVAVLLARAFRGVRIFRVLYTLPLLTAGIVIAISWRFLLNENFGWVNWLLGLAGLPQPEWLSNTFSALPSVILVDAWTGIPLMAILILAGLLSVNQELIDAATVDGASARQTFRYVVLPALVPVITFGVLFQTVNLFRRFELIQLMTGGGPGVATTTLNFYVYANGFNPLSDIGYANALSTLLIGCMLLALFVFFMLAKVRL